MLFGYLDVLAKLGAKEFSHSAATALQADTVKSLTEMELHFPAWELDINRHMILHLAESVPTRGPPWATAMWGYERFWNRMCQWKSQNNHPEAVMINTFKAFKVACKVGGISEVRCFDRPTDEVLMPAYVHAHVTGGEVHVELSDALPKRWLYMKSAKEQQAKAELHMCHLRTHQRYSELWHEYVTDVGQDPTTVQLKDMEKLLDGWLAWGHGQQRRLGAADKELCSGPHPCYYPFDRATVNGHKLVSSRLQKGKYRNDVVMMESAGKGTEVGLIKAFLRAPAPGTALTEDIEGSPDLLELAWVQWFGRSNAANPRGVVCSKEIRSDNMNGNVYRVTDLVPGNIALVPRLLRTSGLSTNNWQALVSRPVVLR